MERSFTDAVTFFIVFDNTRIFLAVFSYYSSMDFLFSPRLFSKEQQYIPNSLVAGKELFQKRSEMLCNLIHGKEKCQNVNNMSVQREIDSTSIVCLVGGAALGNLIWSPVWTVGNQYVLSRWRVFRQIIYSIRILVSTIL